MAIPSSVRESGSYVELQHVEEPRLEITVNNKQYEIIKVRRRVGGSKADWKELDLDKLSRAEKVALVNAAKKSCEVFDRLHNTAPTADLKDAHTLTLQFFQEYESGPGLLNHTLGKHFDRFAWKPRLNTLKEVRYKVSEDSKEKTYQLHLERYSPEEQAKIHKLTKPLTQHLSRLADAQHKNPYTRTLKKKGASQGVKGPTAVLQSAVKEAGSQDNKCAALSIAEILISRGDTRSKEEIARSLITNSIRVINSDASFITDETPQNHALINAIIGYNEAHSLDQIDTNATPIQYRQAYLEKLQANPAEMLDSLFFWTLDKPTIILERSNEAFKIKEFAKEPNFNKSWTRLGLADFNHFNIVLYDTKKKHYQAIILKNQDHLTAMQHVLENHTNALFEEL